MITAVRLDPPAERWVSLRCGHCEVTWRGAPDEPCWSCGRTGETASNAIVVAD